VPLPPHTFDMPEAVYLPDGPDRFVATPLAAGPWDPNGQHAGATAALLAHVMERHDLDGDGGGVLLARYTADLVRPAPLGPLDVAVATVRAGRRAHWLEAEMRAEGRLVARATAVRLVEASLAVPESAGVTDPVPPLPDTLEPLAPEHEAPWLMFWHALDVRPVGDHRALGPGTSWFRLDHPLVAGTENTPLMRVMAAADFTLGISSPLGFDRYTYPNADLTVHLQRAPSGPWVCLESVTRVEPRGSGLAEASVFDERGRVGVAAQSLVVSERAEPLER
jgi:hypothetical protein